MDSGRLYEFGPKFKATQKLVYLNLSPRRICIYGFVLKFKFIENFVNATLLPSTIVVYMGI